MFNNEALWRALLAVLFAAGCGGAEKKIETPEKEDSGSVVVDSTNEYRKSVVPGTGAEEDDDMRLSGTKGQLDSYEVDEAIRDKSRDFHRCFQKAVRKNPYVGGDVEITFHVSASGKLTAVRLSKSDTGAWEFERCLLEVARTVNVPKPQGGKTDFSLPMNFPPQNQVLFMKDDENRKLVKTAAKNCAGSSTSIETTLLVWPKGAVRDMGFASSRKDISDEWAQCLRTKVAESGLQLENNTVAKVTYRL